MKILSASNLCSYINNEDLLMEISKEGAQIIVDLLTDHDLGLVVKENSLSLYNVITEKIVPITIDDVIDMCCDYMYDLVNMHEHVASMTVLTMEQHKLVCKRIPSLKHDQEVLAELYSKTIYGRAARKSMLFLNGGR